MCCVVWKISSECIIDMHHVICVDVVDCQDFYTVNYFHTVNALMMFDIISFNMMACLDASL